MMLYKDESGRSMIELLAAFVVMCMILLAGIYLYQKAVVKVDSHILANDIISMDSQYQANVMEIPTIPGPPEGISYGLVKNSKGWVLAYKISGNKFDEKLCKDLRGLFGEDGWMGKQYAFYPMDKECAGEHNVFCVVPKGKCQNSGGQHKILRGMGCKTLNNDDLTLLNNCL